MSGTKNTGTLIGAVIKQANSADLYPVAEQSDIKGGHHSRRTIAERDAIPVHLREAGMQCYVAANGSTYELKNDLVTWSLLKSTTGGSTLPGTGGDSTTTQLISGNFGEWLSLGTRTTEFFDEQLELRYKGDLLSFPTRAIVYLQGQFGLKTTFAGTTITLGVLPVNTRPVAKLKKYFICKNIELFLVIETTGEVKLISKDGFNLPVTEPGEVVEIDPYYIDCFYNPDITDVESPEEFTSTVRTGMFTRDNCGEGHVGTAVEFTKTYTSTVDEDTANRIADASFEADGKLFANDPANGATCEISEEPEPTHLYLTATPKYDGDNFTVQALTDRVVVGDMLIEFSIYGKVDGATTFLGGHYITMLAGTNVAYFDTSFFPGGMTPAATDLNVVIYSVNPNPNGVPIIY